MCSPPKSGAAGCKLKGRGIQPLADAFNRRVKGERVWQLFGLFDGLEKDHWPVEKDCHDSPVGNTGDPIGGLHFNDL